MLSILVLIFAIVSIESREWHVHAKGVLQMVENVNENNCKHEKPKVLNFRTDNSVWERYTNLAVFTANYLTTRLNQLGGNLNALPDEALFNFASTAVVSGKPEVFSSRIILSPGVFDRHPNGFIPYAYRTKQGIRRKNLLKDNSQGNEYYDALADRNGRNYGIKRLSTILGNGSKKEEYPYFVTRKDGFWSRPYFDCMGGNVWMVTFAVPIIAKESDGKPTMVGVATIDIDLTNVDVNQCEEAGPDVYHNMFRGTHNCPPVTKCVFKPGFGFRQGGYNCISRNGCLVRGLDAEQSNPYALKDLFKCINFRH